MIPKYGNIGLWNENYVSSNVFSYIEVRILLKMLLIRAQNNNDFIQ